MGSPSSPATRFATVRGSRIAYQVFGDGEQTVVAIPPTAQNIELAWEHPAIAAMLGRFATFCRYLHFDKRGTGCSDRDGRIADLDERVDDLRAVMDHAGIDRAHLFGNSEGGPMTLLFAATYPERVSSLILFGTGATIIDPDPTQAELRSHRENAVRYAARWGTDASPVAAGMAPSLAATDPGFITWHQRYERYAASQDSLRKLLELGFHADVRGILAQVRHPVLIIHRADDPVIPVARAHELAEALPNAELFVQPGSDHFSYAGDVDAWMERFERFVTGSVRSRPRTTGAARPQVRIVTLGRFAAEIDGREVPLAHWGSRLARQLCKRLVVARGWPVSRQELCDLMWPDEPRRERLGARLSVQLSGVRRVLRGGVIADRDRVRLDLGEVDTDLEALLSAEDDTSVVDQDTGELLPDDLDEPWTWDARAQVQAHVAAATRRVCRDRFAAGRFADAVPLATRLLELDPYDEGSHLLLIRSLDHAGAAGAALRARESYASAMAELRRSG